MQTPEFIFFEIPAKDSVSDSLLTVFHFCIIVLVYINHPRNTVIVRNRMKKFLKFLAILLLVIVLLAAALFVWISVANKKADFESDDVSAYVNAEPLTDGERYTFSADADTVTMAFDKRDVYWYLTAKYGKDFAEGIIEDFAAEGMQLKGMAISLEEGEVVLQAKVGYGILALNIRIPCTFRYDGSAFVLQPESISALGIDFTKLVGEELSDLQMEIPFEYLILDSVDSVEVSNGCIRFTGPLMVRYMGMAREGFTKEELAGMLDDSRCSYAANILYKYTEDPAEGKYYWMSLLEEDPSLYTTIFEQLLSMISPQTFGGFYLNDRYCGLIFRLIPTYNPLDYQENYKLLAADYSNKL